MPRKARIVKPGFPHHVIQRGNRKMQVFFKPNDYQYYLDLLKEWCTEKNVDVWAYCLMPNHTHVILVPEDEEGMSAAIAQVHQRYTRMINKREGWSGYLWQGRFSSYDMNESHALSAVRYVEMNPVAADLVDRPEDYRWSSARAHIDNRNDPVLNDAVIREMVPDWKDFLSRPEQDLDWGHTLFLKKCVSPESG